MSVGNRLPGMYTTDLLFIPVALVTAVTWALDVGRKKSPEALTVPPTLLMASFTSLSSISPDKYSRTPGMYRASAGSLSFPLRSTYERAI